jgi:uncharacterized protein with HXXEE motif
MNEQLRSILTGTAGLSVAAVIALILTLARDGIGASQTRLRSAVRLAIAAILVQSAHFAEELATGFHQRFPELLGLAPWSVRFFVSFNLIWLAAWVLGVFGLAARWRVALFPLWFLGLGCVVNGIAHPLFSLRTGGYFPGLVTSPLVGVAGVLLLRGLSRVTDANSGSQATLKERPTG